MKKILQSLFAYESLSQEQAREILTQMAQGSYNASQISAFMTVFMMRNITVEELAGFQQAMIDLCIKVDLEDMPTIDVCGTGGDGKDTFNISTLSAFVLAGADIKVSKHGNHGVSSLAGSSTVLEYLGVKFTNDLSTLHRSLERSNVCFMHAPLFHPAMKNVAPIRKELGVKTFFNMLGPMVNPATPTHQLVGVFSLELGRLYYYLYQQKNKQKVKNFIILHSVDGYDEISLTNEVKFFTKNKGEKLLTPFDLKCEYVIPEEIFGGKTIEDAGKIFMNILENKGTITQNMVLLANSTAGVQCFYPEKSWEECWNIAQESLLSGNALKKFNTFLKENQ